MSDPKPRKCPELRRDPTSGRWTIVAMPTDKEKKLEASHRHKKPQDHVIRPYQAYDQNFCPFAQAFSEEKRQEKEPIFGLRWKKDAVDEVEVLWSPNPAEMRRIWHSGDWEVILVRTDYAQLDPRVHPDLFGDAPFASVAGFGIHELIIEDPTEEHAPLGVMPWKRTMLILLAALYRLKGDLGLQNSRPCFPRIDAAMFTPLAQTQGVRHFACFHNYLKEAGASQEHPHSQIIASPIIPTDVAAELDFARRRSSEPLGRCVYCQVIETEKHLETEKHFEKRVLFENAAIQRVEEKRPLRQD
jgi:UDPglucose--hexose-1-phosphate uridylyltransferase